MESKERKSTAEIYQAVTKARPELEVLHLSVSRAPREGFVFYRGFERDGGTRWMSDDEAEALIESKWLRALPCDLALWQSVNGYWAVQTLDDQTARLSTGPTPLEALAEFYCPGSSQVAAQPQE